MVGRLADSESPCAARALEDLFPPTCRILDRPVMLYRPFGKNIDGAVIKDMAGVSIKSNVEHLEEYVTQTQGNQAGEEVVTVLVQRLNERIPDRSYHVTPRLLRNPWASYSNEFTAYLVEFCVELSGDHDFQFNMGRSKLIPPLVQTLMRPFSVLSIYKGATRWIKHYAKNSYDLEGIVVTEGSAILRLSLMERALNQFGPYRRACAKIWCNAIKVGVSIVPQKVHGLEPAAIVERKCMTNGDDYCEWEVSWKEPTRRWVGTQVVEQVARRVLQNEIVHRERVIEEQTSSLKTRHEELEASNVELQQTVVELQRKVNYLVTLHEASIRFTSLKDSEALLQDALEILRHKLSYDRVMMCFFDETRKLSHDARIVGVTDELTTFVRKLEIPVTDPLTIEGTVLLRGLSVLVQNSQELLERLHPLHRELALKIGSQSFVAVPLKTQNGVLGSLTVDRAQPNSLSHDDVEIMTTFASQLAIAIDSVTAYHHIEQMNANLEQKVLERTVQLGVANEQLKKLDQIRSELLHAVSHDLRQPMASIHSHAENVLQGLFGPINEKQAERLAEILSGVDRVMKMREALLYLAQIESDTPVLRPEWIDLQKLVGAVADSLRETMREKAITFETFQLDDAILLEADRYMLIQILTNLLENAVKFTPPGGHVQVLSKIQSEGYAEVRVTDSGCGIVPDDIPKVFEKFFRGASTMGTIPGSGLGLAIVKRLVELHGGKVGVESTVGVGSSFFVTLPMNQSSSLSHAP
ncbi:MAG: ATP-binding protein [Nitrospira sp.]|nr:ATP-binding protein [Nitrospira sp.]